MIKALLILAASTADLPAADHYVPQPFAQHDSFEVPAKRSKPATMWKIRVEGEKGEWLVPISIMKEYGLKAGTVVSVETARMIAQEMGAIYEPDILEKLEKLK